MITGNEIIKRHALGEITIEPFDEKSVGPNSYDVRLGDTMALVTDNAPDIFDRGYCVNTSIPSKVTEVWQEEDGSFRLEPNCAYLAHTIETIGSDLYVPTVHGRSTAARHGLVVHYAGLGDLGWKGQVVLELVNLTGYPMYIKPGVRLAQICWHPVVGDIRLYNSTYQNQVGIVPAKALT